MRTDRTSGSIHHQQIYGMVSERVIRMPAVRIEEAVMLDLWAESQGVRFIEIYRTLKDGDEHTVALVDHPVHGRVILKTVRPENVLGGWSEFHLYVAIREAQREMGVASFVVPEPIAIHELGAFSVFFYFPLPGRSLASKERPVFERGALLQDIHGLVRSDALADLPGLALREWWGHLQAYLAELLHAGLDFSDEVYAWTNRALVQASQSLDKTPRALIHGDFHASNVIEMQDGRIGIIDWEFARAGHGLEDYASLHLERLALGLRPEPAMDEYVARHDVERATVMQALDLLLAKQLMKRIAFARIRREDRVLEADYIHVLEGLVGAHVIELDKAATRRATTSRVYSHPGS